MSETNKQCNSIASFLETFKKTKEASKDKKTGKAYGFVQGRIESINEKDVPNKTRKEGEPESWHIHEYTISDGTSFDGVSKIVISIFMEKDKPEQFKVGEVLKATDLVAKEFKNEVQLKTTSKSFVAKSSESVKEPVVSKDVAVPKDGGAPKDADLVSKIMVRMDVMQSAIMEQLKEIVKALVKQEIMKEIKSEKT